MEREDLPRATALGKESLAAAQSIGDRRLTVQPLLLLGMTARCQGELERSARLLSESLVLLRQVGDRWAQAIALHNLGVTAAARGD
jgi:hypothetical protein